MESLSTDRLGDLPLARARAYGPLPSGRHALPEELVVEHQEARLQRAILEVSGELGYEETAVRDVLERAATSRRVFYTLYSSKAECFIAAYKAGAEHLAELAADTASRPPDWPERLRAALRAILSFLDEEPSVARALIIEVHAAGPQAQSARAEVMRQAVRALDGLRGADHGPRPIATPLTSEGVLGGIEQSVRSELRRERPGGLLALLPGLMEFALASYLGPDRARERLAAPSG